MSKVTAVLVLNPFTIDLDSHSLQHGLSDFEDTLTIQADKEQSDINFIVKQFGITHELPYGEAIPAYDDYSDYPTDYHSAMNFIRDSDKLFMDYPAEIRSRFENDAGKFLDFVREPSNYDEAISLGLVPPRPSVESVDTAAVDAKSTDSKPAA